jgi:CO/xanthine dehydrogenase Mo-binding subunit
MNQAIGLSIPRKESWEKVTGEAAYTDDLPSTGMLVARLLTSTCASARIKSIDTSRACALEGVKAVLTGDMIREMFGPLVLDRPALAREFVRYAGEPVAMVIAIDKPTAEAAVRLIRPEYEQLPFVLTPTAALKPGAHLVHGDSAYRKVMRDVYPEPGTNVASRYRVRKGNAEEVLPRCEVIVEQSFSLPPSDHVAMEVRTARAEISRDGVVTITTSSQSPYAVRKQLSDAFMIPSGNIRVKVPFVGGGFGGKAPTVLEILAYLASRAVGGRPVRVTIPREQDMASAPCRLGLDATIRLGANREGLIQAAMLTYYLDCGAYTDISPYMTKAIATDCTGPYRVENLSCNAVCVYTNHTYATSYRSFAHESCTFSMERALDLLSRKCEIDPLELRLKNAIRPGDTTPSQTVCTPGLIGDLPKCIEGVRDLSQWIGGVPVPVKPDTVRAMGVSCFWKTPNPPTNAVSGAVVTFNPDGSMNLLTGVVEMGAGGQTHLAQMLAEKRPCVVDFHVEREENVWPMVPAGKSLHEMDGLDILERLA